jgi:hypothetical protein
MAPPTHISDSKEANEARIVALYSRLQRVKDGTQKMNIREEIDSLLEEHHIRWPQKEVTYV